jgi:hypothetical protein
LCGSFAATVRGVVVNGRAVRSSLDRHLASTYDRPRLPDAGKSGLMGSVARSRHRLDYVASPRPGSEADRIAAWIGPTGA